MSHEVGPLWLNILAASGHELHKPVQNDYLLGEWTLGKNNIGPGQHWGSGHDLV